MTAVINESRTVRLALAVLLVVLTLLILDLAGDMAENVSPMHLLSEMLAAIVAGGGVVLLVLRVRELDQTQQRLARRLASSQHELAKWREEAGDLVSGLRGAMDRQFDRWGLTPAESNIAVLLLRGLSHKQIAGRRESSERTVRQQAHMLYRKAGIAGRSDLAAFFLSDLFEVQQKQSVGSANPSRIDDESSTQ